MTVADHIKHMLTLPQDMEVWRCWDESGEYLPAEEPLGRVDTICRSNGRSWRERYPPERNVPTDKQVCVLERATR